MRLHLGRNLAARGGRNSSPISATAQPVLAALTEGDTLSSAVTWGSYTSSVGSIVDPTTKEMSVDLGAYVAYNGAAVVAGGETYSLRETVADSAGNTRQFFSELQAVQFAVPAFTAQPTADNDQIVPGGTVTFTPGTASVGAVSLDFARFDGSTITLTANAYTSTNEGEVTYREKAVNGPHTVFSDTISVLVNAAPEITGPVLDTGVSPAELSFTTTEFGDVWYATNGSATPLTGAAIRALVEAASPAVYGTAEVTETSPTFPLPSLAPLGAGTFYLHVTVEDGLGAFSTDAVTTLTLAAPTISSSVPADNATGVEATASITVTFSEAIAFGTGLVTLRQNNSGWSDAEAFDVAVDVGASDGQVSISGSTLTINPTGTLVGGREYAIRIASTAITDIHGLAFAGIADDTSRSFTIDGGSAAPTIEGTSGPTGSAGSIVVTWPAGHASGDHLYVFVSTSGNDTITAPGSPTTVVNYATDVNADDAEITVFRYTAAGSSEADLTFTDGWNCAMIGSVLVRGGGTPVASSGVGVDGGSSIAPPGGTTSAANTLIFHAVATQQDTDTPQVSSLTNGDLTSVTSRLSGSTSATGGAGLAVYSGLKATAGAYGAATATLAGTQTNWTAAVTIEIPPA